MKKTTQLKQLLLSPQTEFIMEAHNGLSAKIVEETGFKGIWASGLSISAALGVRDNNEASWTQVLETVEFMADGTNIPILLDGDTGYGNFNNMRRLVKKLCQRDIAGVCIEDKIFPKTNSFLRGEAQPLAPVEEFCGKIKAGKDAQTDSDFVIVARVEAFIAGWGLAEALARAEAYRLAGADAILIHSKQNNPEEIFAFLKEWGNRAPVVIVPTKYYSTPTPAFEERKVSLVIWANHLVRGAVKKMQEIARQIHQDQNLMAVEDQVVPVSEIFRLQGDEELKEAEKLYLSQNKQSHSAVILAATQGKALGDLTLDRPKCMIELGGKSILEKQLDALGQHEVKDISVVVGYKPECIRFPNLNLVPNPDYETTNELASLACALPKMKGNCLVLFGDILFRSYFIGILMRDKADVVVIVDRPARPPHKEGRRSDYVRTSAQGGLDGLMQEEITLNLAANCAYQPEYDGEWTGLMKLSEAGLLAVKQHVEAAKKRPDFGSLQLVDLLNGLIQTGVTVKVQPVQGNWTDLDSLVDLKTASQF